MYILDDFLPKDIWADLLEVAHAATYEIHKHDGFEMALCELPKEYRGYFEQGDLIASYIRRSTGDFDTSLNIHCDSIVNGRKVSNASVYYLDVEKTGTVFWSHYKHGSWLEDYSDYNEVLKDRNNKEAWSKRLKVFGACNRLVSFSANAFHSKCPESKGDRYVIICFYG